MYFTSWFALVVVVCSAIQGARSSTNGGMCMLDAGRNWATQVWKVLGYDDTNHYDWWVGDIIALISVP